MNVAAGLIREVAEIGEHLGFTVDPEHWAVDYKEVGVYRPRIDCVWADSLSSYGYDASPLNAVLPAPLAEPYGLFGFEVEAMDPTTKSQFANLTNLALAAVPYAVLVVNVISAGDGTARNYERAYEGGDESGYLGVTLFADNQRERRCL